jgi:transposase
MATNGTIGLIPGYTDLKTNQIQAVQLRFADKSYAEIAATLNVHIQTVKQWFSRGPLSGALEAYTRNLIEPEQSAVMTVQSKIKSHAHAAVDRMHSLLNADSEDVQFRSAKDLLDRAGYAPIQKNLNIESIADMNDDQLLDELKIIEAEVTGDDGPTTGAQNAPYIEEGPNTNINTVNETKRQDNDGETTPSQSNPDGAA